MKCLSISKLFQILTVFFLFIACGDTGRRALPPPPVPDNEISSSTLSGSIHGMAWEHMNGRASKRIINGENTFVLEIWGEDPEAADLCDPFVFVDRVLLISTPQVLGVYEINLNRAANFYSGNSNLVVPEGLIVLEDILLNEIPPLLIGGMRSFYDEDNRVNGMFELVICEN